MRAQLNRAAYELCEFERWNALNDFLAMSDVHDLSPLQRNAYYAYWYASEVENGGHYQYFINQGNFPHSEVILALRSIKADRQADILEKAWSAYSGKNLRQPDSVDEYHDNEQEADLDQYDTEFYNCSTSIIPDLLEQFLDLHESDFIEWV